VRERKKEKGIRKKNIEREREDERKKKGMRER